MPSPRTVRSRKKRSPIRRRMGSPRRAPSPVGKYFFLDKKRTQTVRQAKKRAAGGRRLSF